MRLGQKLRAEGRIAHDRQPLGHALVLDRLVGAAHRERGAARLQPLQHADRPRRHLRLGGMTLGRQPLDQAEQAPPALGLGMALRQRHRERPARRREQPVDHLELALGIGRVEVGDEFDDAAAGVLHAERDAQKLGLGGAQRRRRIALHGAMVERARGREAERAGAHGLGRERAHLGDLFRRGFLELRGALAHDEHAQGAVRQLGAEIHVARPRLERVEILAEGFPRPVQPFVERRAGNVLDAFHQFDQALAILDLHRREADAAIAHHRRGDAMPARGLQMRIPGRLAVIVRMDVDEARRDQQALGVDLLGAAAGDLADGGDLAVLHRDIGFVQRRAGAVGHRAAADDQIEFLAMFVSPGLPEVYLIVSGGRTPATALRRSGSRRSRATAIALAWRKAPGRRGRRRARRRCRTRPRPASPSGP